MRWGSPGNFATLLGAGSVCGTTHIFTSAAPTLCSLALFSIVLPGGCPACDTHALQEALLCLKRHYAAFPLPSGISFNDSLTFLENAADVGGLAIALQVCKCQGPQFMCTGRLENMCSSFPATLPDAGTVIWLSALHIPPEQTATWGSPSYPRDLLFLGHL